MTTRPAITVSTLDYERLATLLETCDGAHAVAAQLEAELERAEVLEPDAMPANVVTMNSTARIRLGEDQEKQLTLVYPRDADSEQNRISVLAPIGAALLGLSVGQSIDWPTPSGLTHLTILELVYQPEASGDLHR
ncbi:nucleoside diphosphate kinase regulator [Chromobacterium sp. IIBBL 290-4]|uniref:nucleoside diphosphate kinase regulator n=1 Tax=Chromobacterium sp. IIBBL 290-4 TaxID=2953890 RepID=UPI0020B8650B|nr:nucleoside diphosphate kinase regulator [Chromobacterium sp. IIBBL 290-4]UTH73269.1 nucleoside diphosphate kinase regulator [Chromobacterium sp. IIBBL 290-4]